jgi:hypothetical protein
MNQNQIIAEAMGKCYHQFHNGGFDRICMHCDHQESRLWGKGKPDYTSNDSDWKELLDWLMDDSKHPDDLWEHFYQWSYLHVPNKLNKEHDAMRWILQNLPALASEWLVMKKGEGK